MSSIQKQLKTILITSNMKYLFFLFILIPTVLKSQVKYVFLESAVIEESNKTLYLNTLGAELKVNLSRKNSLSFKSSWIGGPVGLVFKQNFISKNNLNFSVMSMVISSGSINKGKTFGGLHMGILTFGSSRKNISFSGGLAHINWTENPENGSVFMDNARNIGDKNSYSFYDDDHPYYIPPVSSGSGTSGNFSFMSAFQNTVNGGTTYDDRRFYKSKQLASVIGFSGLFFIKDRVSIILESMLFYSKIPQLKYIGREIDVTYTYNINNPATGTSNYQTETQTVIYGEGVESNKKNINTTLSISPCIRFEKKNIFQLGLTLFVNNRSDDNSIIFPIPQFSFIKRMN